MNKDLIIFTILSVILNLTIYNKLNAQGNVIPVPDKVMGVRNPLVSLNGTWKFSMNPPERFWENSVSPIQWDDVQVPGELLMQGFNIQQDVEYAYKTKINIPEDFKGKRIMMQFDGVYSYGRVWINGSYLRSHYGGFTTWNCDITKYVVPGEAAWVTVGVTDLKDDISMGSNYAKHNIGGIIRKVNLIAVPENYLSNINVETDLDTIYKNALLKVYTEVIFNKNTNAEIILSLKDSEDNNVKLAPNSFELSKKSPENLITISIENPKKWDAEHPNLYTLTAKLQTNNEILEIVSTNIGFREVEQKGNELYINGMPVILKGVNRHSVHPTLGRAITDELAWLDAKLLKEANVNFVRTSHYPPTTAFLDACDYYGIYVEEESAVMHGNLNYIINELYGRDQPDFRERYMNQFAEMLNRDRNHPSVIMWSLGNESAWGQNIQDTYEYCKIEDKTRPVVFSYPNSRVPVGIKVYDIYSVHYNNYSANMGHQSIRYPVLHDELAHVATYNVVELRRDPGVRNFWGHSIKRFAEELYTNRGALGGAIWCGIDEIFLYPEMEIQEPDARGMFSPFGYGTWGIIDGWRRPKPEYWLTKKAYSPIRLENNTGDQAYVLLPEGTNSQNFSPYNISNVANPGKNNQLVLPIENRFDHTNLNEIDIKWSVNTESGFIPNINIEPRNTGELCIPARKWEDGDVIQLGFYQYDSLLIDTFNITIGKPVKEFSEWDGLAPRVLKNGKNVVIEGTDFQLIFDREKGSFSSGSYQGKNIITGGPHLNLIGSELLGFGVKGKYEYDDQLRMEDIGEVYAMNDWKCENTDILVKDNYILITKEESASDLKVAFKIEIYGDGMIRTKYKIIQSPRDQIEGGYDELGIKYLLSDEIDRLSWERAGLYSVYPDDHIGRNKGVAFRTINRGNENYGEEPVWPWSLDMKDYYLYGRKDIGGRGTRDFKSMKTNIWYASAITRNGKERVRVESNLQHAVRLGIVKNGRSHIWLNINTKWNYFHLTIGGNYVKPAIYLRKDMEGEVQMRLTNTDEIKEVFNSL